MIYSITIYEENTAINVYNEGISRRSASPEEAIRFIQGFGALAEKIYIDYADKENNCTLCGHKVIKQKLNIINRACAEIVNIEQMMGCDITELKKLLPNK